MKTFIVLYYNTSGEHQATPELTEKQQEEMMAPWFVWQSKYGDRIVDLGSPLMAASSSNNGKVWSSSRHLVTGYSIVAAQNLEEAQKMFQDHPIYNYPDHAVEISETAAM